MRPYFLHPRMTPARRSYLRAVERHGIYEPRHGVVANHCLRLGWTESVLRLADGRTIAHREYRPGDSRVVEWLGQRLTADGRDALRQAAAR